MIYERPIAAVAKGLVAGAVGTAAMTAYQAAVAKARGTEPSKTPGEIARRILGGVLRRDVPDEPTTAMNNAMHWTYGTSWGAVYGSALGSTRWRGSPGTGIAFGLFVWGTSLIELPALGLSPPVWEWPSEEVVLDVSYHLVYGVATAAAFAALRRG